MKHSNGFLLHYIYTCYLFTNSTQNSKMINSKSFSTGIHTQFYLPSNSFNPSPSRNLSFNSKNPLLSIRKTPDRLSNASATDCVYTQSDAETLYDLLGVPKSGTPSEIKRAYKQMALKYHPDVSPPDQVDEYTTMFIRVQEAYETLSDPGSRAVYDCNLAKGLHLAFNVKKGSRIEPRSEEMARWKQSWEVQVEELKRRSTAETERMGPGGRMSWAARIRKQRD
ncbi:putative DnaJ domain, Chaperone J-domain superfamily [Helianthus annuus]|nr:putative DnaJ domain, Chaperone J-domain superfamily [Helianthus annuus]